MTEKRIWEAALTSYVAEGGFKGWRGPHSTRELGASAAHSMTAAILTSIQPYHVARPYPVTLSQLQLTAADTAEHHAVSSQRLCGHASNNVISDILRNITKIKRSEPALQAASDMLWHLICYIDTGNIILK
jgi:hypothetical protein